MGVAVEHGTLAIFFVVEEEGGADFGVVGPLGVEGVLAVACEFRAVNGLGWRKKLTFEVTGKLVAGTGDHHVYYI